MKLWRVILAAGLFVTMVPLVHASAATRTVSIPGRFYSPERVSIVMGDTVRWVNSSNERHSVTATSDSISRGESFDSHPNCGGGFLFNRCMRPGGSYAHTFSVRGTFTYYCRQHGRDAAYPDCGMCARVTVVRKASPTITPTTPGSTPSTPPASISPSPSPSASPTSGGTRPEDSGFAAPDPDDDGNITVLALAALGVVLLGTSGYFVYRTMIRG